MSKSISDQLEESEEISVSDREDQEANRIIYGLAEVDLHSAKSLPVTCDLEPADIDLTLHSQASYEKEEELSGDSDTKIKRKPSVSAQRLEAASTPTSSRKIAPTSNQPSPSSTSSVSADRSTDQHAQESQFKGTAKTGNLRPSTSDNEDSFSITSSLIRASSTPKVQPFVSRIKKSRWDRNTPLPDHDQFAIGNVASYRQVDEEMRRQAYEETSRRGGTDESLPSEESEESPRDEGSQARQDLEKLMLTESSASIGNSGKESLPKNQMQIDNARTKRSSDVPALAKQTISQAHFSPYEPVEVRQSKAAASNVNDKPVKTVQVHAKQNERKAVPANKQKAPISVPAKAQQTESTGGKPIKKRKSIAMEEEEDLPAVAVHRSSNQLPGNSWDTLNFCTLSIRYWHEHQEVGSEQAAVGA
jgi:hypothetical protein